MHNINLFPAFLIAWARKFYGSKLIIPRQSTETNIIDTCFDD